MKKFNSKEIGAILTFKHLGSGGIGGQMVGADGSGTFCVIFMGSPFVAETAAYEYARKLNRYGAGVRDVCIVAAHEGYSGIPISVIEVE